MFDCKKDFEMGIESTQVQFPFINIQYEEFDNILLELWYHL